MHRYLVKVLEPDSGAVMFEHHVRTLKEALYFFDKAEKAIVIYVGDTVSENKVIKAKGY